MKPRILSDRDLYLFDTQGFLLVPKVLTEEEVNYYCNLLSTTKPHRWFDFAKAERWDNIIELDPKLAALSGEPRVADRAFDVINQPMRLIETYAMAYHPGGFLYMHNGNTQSLTYTDGTYATRNMAYRCE